MSDGRAALRAAAHRVLASDAGATAVGRLCPRCGASDHGRPWARVAAGASPAVSLAYADGLAAVAWGHAGPVGVDVEVDGPPLVGYGSRQEWTRLEALLKAAGTGLTRDPIDPAGLPDLPTWPLDLPPGYVGTVAGVDVTCRLVVPDPG